MKKNEKGKYKHTGSQPSFFQKFMFLSHFEIENQKKQGRTVSSTNFRKIRAYFSVSLLQMA